MNDKSNKEDPSYEQEVREAFEHARAEYYEVLRKAEKVREHSEQNAPKKEKLTEYDQPDRKFRD